MKRWSLIALAVALPALGGELRGKLMLASKEEAEKFVVYVAEVPPEQVTIPPGRHHLSQRGATFHPTVLPVVRGTTVDLTNDDWLIHSVYSKSALHPFDLGSYPRAERKQITFDEEGPIEVLCSIHPRMRAVVLVLQNPFFAKPDASGAFSIPGIPPGKYQLRVYGLDEPIRTATVTVKAKGPTEVQASALKAAPAPAK